MQNKDDLDYLVHTARELSFLAHRNIIIAFKYHVLRRLVGGQNLAQNLFFMLHLNKKTYVTE
jgi:hypothetical protein